LSRGFEEFCFQRERGDYDDEEKAQCDDLASGIDVCSLAGAGGGVCSDNDAY
jgi:hypothetical protein